MEKGNAKLHFFDKYLGIPLILFLGIFRVFKSKIHKDFVPKRIAILNISSIGDNVLMSAPIKDIKLRYPDSSITVFCGETNLGIIKLLSHVDVIEKLSIKNIFKSAGKIISEGHYDLLIDFGPWPRLNALFSFFFNAKIKIGFNSVNQFRHYVYDYAIIHSDQRHELDNYRQLLVPMGIHSCSAPELDLKGKSQILNENYMIFHPWPGGYKSYMKEWPLENWVNLAERLHDSNITIYMTGAPSDIEASLKLEKASNGLIKSLAGKYSLLETSIIVKYATLLVSVNTGIMHIGATLDTPLVALHGPTSIKRWGPVSQNAIAISPQSNDCGYLHFGYEYYKNKVNCMELITVDQVYTAVVSKLNIAV